MIGPLSTSLADVAAVYAVIAQPNVRNENVRFLPPLPVISSFAHSSQSLSHLRVGVYRPWYSMIFF